MTAAGVLRGEVLELSHEEYLLAWSHLGLGLMHWNLQPPGGSERTFEERMVLRRQAWQALGERGLVGAQRLSPALEEALHLIARPVAELNGRLDLPEGPCTVVGSARGERGAVAQLSTSGLRLWLTRSAALPAAVAAVVPDRPAGSGTAASVPAHLLPDRQGMTAAAAERALVHGGTRPDDARRFRAMLQGPKLGGGKFGAARYDQQGRRHVAEFVVSYYDTARGGYTIEQRRGVDRSRWYTLAPAGRSQLAQRLAHLLDSIRM